MASALGYPSHDPHGAPIPTTTGDIEHMDLATLADAAPGARLRIQAVRDEEAKELRTMAADGLLPGVNVLVNKGQHVEGVVDIVVGDSQGPSLAVKTELAKRIYVELHEE